MTIQSMTGFSRSQGQFGDHEWVWEMRSVNGKGLDLRFRMPPGFEALEIEARKAAQKQLARGNVQISLQTSRSAGAIVPTVNQAAADAIMAAARDLQKKVGGELPTVADLLNIRGVLDLEEERADEAERRKLEAAMLESFEEALGLLVAMRRREGEAVSQFLNEQLAAISACRQEIEATPERSPQSIRERFEQQLSELAGNAANLDPQRLHQEVAILATKADIQEELDRLAVHLASAREILAGEKPAGRKLDFLSQEFNRECNTICSKSNSAAVSSLGVDMKLLIDKFREQVQNME